MGSRKKSNKGQTGRKVTPASDREANSPDASADGGKILVPAFTVVILLLIAAAVMVVMKPAKNITGESTASPAAVSPARPDPEQVSEEELALKLLDLPTDPNPEQIINALQTQLARKDSILTTRSSDRRMDPRNDPVLQSMPVPGAAAKWLAGRIPQDAPQLPSVLKAIGEQRYDEARLLADELLTKLDGAPDVSNADIARLRVAGADADYFAGRYSRAVAGYRSALPLFPLDPVIRYNLARALIRTPPPRDAQRLLEAVQILSDLEGSEFTSPESQKERGLVHLGLGLAMWNLPVGDSAVSRIQAVEHYQAALEVLDQQSFPVDWARTQVILGDLFRDRLDGDRTENLAVAMSHYREALQVFGREKWPIQWSGLQSNLGDAYSALPLVRPADLENNMRAALSSYRNALSVLRRENAPNQWASTQIGMGMALNRLVEKNALENLSNAVICFNEALSVFDRADHAPDWAIAQNNLGTSSINLAEVDVPANRQDHIERAIRYFQSALEVLDRTTHPRQWASAQANLGAAFVARTEGNVRENLSTAESCFLRAAEVFTAERFPDYYRDLDKNLTDVRARLADTAGEQAP